MNRNIFPLLIILYLFISCTDENDLDLVSIGDNFISSQTHVVIVDSFSLKLSTFIIDSIPANSPDNLLVGRYSDALFGEVSSTSYFQVNAPTYAGIDDDAIFDSLTLVLDYDGLSYGDTTKERTIFVHEVLEEIEETDDSYIYNTSKFKFNDVPLGSIKFTPEPNKDDSLEIRLDDNWGMTLMQMMKDNADEISTADDFLDYFKGVALVPGDEDASLLSFKSTDSLINIVLYTHLKGQTRTETSYRLPMYSAETCFNNVVADRTETFIGNLTTQKENISSAQTDNKSYIQAGTGIVTRLDFTGLEKIMELDTRNVLYKAELILRPAPDSDEQIDFPEELMLYTTDEYNRLTAEVQNDNDETLLADFYFDDMYREDIHYTFDITDFIMDELSDSYFNPENGLIITFPSETFQSTGQRLVIDARSGDNYRPTLKLYFLMYE
ncbi:DUF4270 family protein [Maribellus comscasis]|uniref:DUF4270 family protein n=1 Tax=Maribellus comscasis TaxID=2681766 RepID=A0A6I6JX37_9BACT|nr:DUF4270 family protein [Maribellus comscasis]QGY45658.1 DUF4270 family protein [Maribellus comscasis]